VQDTQAEIDGNICATIGDASFAQDKNYEATLPQRGVVNQLEKRLSYSTTPLRETQRTAQLQRLALPVGTLLRAEQCNTMLIVRTQLLVGRPRVTKCGFTQAC